MSQQANSSVQAKVASEGRQGSEITFAVESRPGLTMQCATAAARNFVDNFYETLNRGKSPVQYYVSSSAKLTNVGGLKPDISINGRVCGSSNPNEAGAAVAEYEQLLEAQRGGSTAPVHYEIHSFDAQPLNPNYVIGLTPAEQQQPVSSTRERDVAERLSFGVQVEGAVRLGRGEDAAERDFNEAFVLVPHWEAHGRNASRNMRKWLVVSQNFRSF
ncbi:Nuclear transport factor 2 domain containing protein [Apiospora phragmitis]|uniref:Nuclear transport factor 2 domain containing protein n=1 Tax=Apiospora phragmitis TaxID=2905665 RepID=A0ABR1T435_9PEZI